MALISEQCCHHHLFLEMSQNVESGCNCIISDCHSVNRVTLNRQINEKILSLISSSGLVQIQNFFTRNDKILDLLCTNKPDLFSDIRSIPGISDHKIILADCDLKPVVCKKPPRTIYLWNKVDSNSNTSRQIVIHIGFPFFQPLFRAGTTFYLALRRLTVYKASN